MGWPPVPIAPVINGLGRDRAYQGWFHGPHQAVPRSLGGRTSRRPASRGKDPCPPAATTESTVAIIGGTRGRLPPDYPSPLANTVADSLV